MDRMSDEDFDGACDKVEKLDINRWISPFTLIDEAKRAREAEKDWENEFCELGNSYLKLKIENADVKGLLADSIGNWDKLKKAYDQLKEEYKYSHYNNEEL